MHERSIFMAALEHDTPQKRSTYLDQACAGDTVLRQRVEALLRSHEQAGEFLGKPAPERLAEKFARMEKPEDTKEEIAAADEQDSEALGFLAPADKPGVLGRLGHYEVLDVIGRGGTGIVLRAFDKTLHRVVAIKVLAAQLASSGVARQRFSREAQAAAAVCHDHIVTIHAVEEGASPYMVMQYVPGVSLQHRLDREGPLPLREILRIGMQTASGLAAAHAQGLIHRDVKPANILLENGIQRVKITDFGMARTLADASLTASGVITGTPQYMAPEQARGQAVDARTDLFSLGSVLYALCTGRPPFRASGSLAVLKRVCEETPSPIRESNPEIPEWLVAIIDKLHAKDPAQRFQSAAEVAGLLSERLAQLQHASVVSEISNLPVDAKQGFQPVPPRRRWTVVAAISVLLLLGGLSLTEATGVTNLGATVIRIATPDGTLVVEADDPRVKVTVEGDSGLVITGAGLEEIRLRPGNYHVHADRDGKRLPLERELVSIARGGREVVKVKLEAMPAKAATGAFVLLAAGKERRFETLVEAVLGASDGDTIEVRGNGPFVIKPITIENRLTIRAGEGFRPVIKADPDEQGTELLLSMAPLILEGLDLQWVGAKAFDPSRRASRLIVSSGPASRLQVANCRFLMNRREGPPIRMSCMAAWDMPLCHVRNCQFVVGGNGEIRGPSLVFKGSPHGELTVDNCLIVGHGVQLELTHAEPMKVRLHRNTFLGQSSSTASFYPGKKIDPPSGKDDPRPIQMDISANILEGQVQFAQFPLYLAKHKALSAKEAEQLLTQLVGWRESRNLYLLPEDRDLLRLVVETPSGRFTRLPPTLPITTLDDWKNFWGMAELDSERGEAQFQGGDLNDRARRTPSQLTPEDFRLRSDCAGYRAGKDGKDLGADVDLVGPGPAYERWKKTPQYQQWLKDTGQAKNTEAVRPEPKAFVILDGKGIEVRKYDSLAEAVLGSSDGDTIEVRGNGPFVIQPIRIEKPLTVRAGEGFRPVIKADPDEQGKVLLLSLAPLILEGLEFHWVKAKAFDRSGPDSRLVVANGPASRLQVANCRFLMNRREGPPHGMSSLGAWNTPLCHFRNCEFVHPAGQALSARLAPRGRLTMDNCLHLSTTVGFALEPSDAAVNLTSNTFVMGGYVLWLIGNKAAATPMPISAAGNVLSTNGPVLNVDLPRREPLTDLKTANQQLRKLITWRDRRNLYASGKCSWQWSVLAVVQPLQSPKDLAEWIDFWETDGGDSLEGQVRMQGGNLLARVKGAPEKITPDDFRLRADSAGYRAGKDKKDLGADVDLVGPGKPYERWKKTPQYQQWLKDTSQSVVRGR